ncbi:MAG: hypothetical protein ACKOZU_08750 [Planctomycetaceae bacterium]
MGMRIFTTRRWALSKRYRRDGKPPVLFVHVPKTAGTSLRRMLQASLGMQAVYPSDADLARRKDGGYPLAAEVLRELPTIRPYGVLVGHFVAGIVRHLPVPHRAATMLRDPVQRSLSMLAHLHVHRGLSPKAVMESEYLRSNHIADYQTRLLGAEHEEEFDHATDAHLERALRNLEAFEFVGITERFPESCRWFDRLFGTAVSSVIRESNVLRPGGRGYEEFIPSIEPLVARDRVLYERACARFDRDSQAMLTATAAA